MNKTTAIFELSAREVLERLHDDYSQEALYLKGTASELVLEFHHTAHDEYINGELVGRLFTLYRRAMNYLIDKRR